MLSRIPDDLAAPLYSQDKLQSASDLNPTPPSELGRIVLREWVFLCETIVPLIRKL